MINVVEKQVQRRDSLDESALDLVPFLGGNDARQQIERENAFRPLVVVVNREGNALAEKSGSGQGAFPLKFLAVHFLEARQQFAVMGPRHAGSGKHFIKKIPDLIIGEEIAHKFSLAVR